MRTVLSIRLPPTPHAPGLARTVLGELPSRFHSLLDALRVMVSELVTNSVVHADLGSDDRIELMVREAADHLRVDVWDPGASYEEALAAWNLSRDGVAQARAPVGGYGFLVVDALADRSGVTRDSGTVVWFELDLQSSKINHS